MYNILLLQSKFSYNGSAESDHSRINDGTSRKAETTMYPSFNSTEYAFTVDSLLAYKGVTFSTAVLTFQLVSCDKIISRIKSFAIFYAVSSDIAIVLSISSLGIKTSPLVVFSISIPSEVLSTVID